MAFLKVSPQSALVDEDVTMVIEGLQRNQAVTLVGALREEKVKMASYAHYVADDNGIVDVTKMESLGGTYTGVEPMGFIWSMQITENKKAGRRLMKRNVCEAIKMDVQLYRGHITQEEVVKSRPECLASQQIERWYLSNNTERVEVHSGRLEATMFIPKGKGPFPGVLDLFGSIGGLVEYRASLLASHGFVTMSLAYFWSNKKKMNTDLEYFEEALEYLWKHPKVLKTGLGAIGVSKGAELTFLIAVTVPKLRAVVGINGPPFPIMTTSTYHGETFEAEDFSGFETTKTDEGSFFEFSQFYELNKFKPVIPIERSQAKFLLVHGADDRNTPGTATVVFPARLAEVGRADDCKVLMYEGAGHLIEPPHSPHFRTSYHAMINDLFLWGGEPKLHARAQEDSWQQIQTFLRHTLTSLPQQINGKL